MKLKFERCGVVRRCWNIEATTPRGTYRRGHGPFWPALRFAVFAIGSRKLTAMKYSEW